MRFYGLSGVLIAVALVLGSHAVSAADAPKAADAATGQPKATDLIFERKHLAKTEAGKQIDYKFKRTASDEKILGQSFNDDITLKVTGDKPDGNKDLTLQIYTGDRARDRRSWRSTASIRSSPCSFRRPPPPSISSPAAR